MAFDIPQRWTGDHFLALDIALAYGLTVRIGDKDFQLSPLRYIDLAELVMQSRSRGLATYQHASDHGMGVQYKQRAMDLNSILFGTEGIDVLSLLTNPTLAADVMLLSLQPKHPDLTLDEARVLVDTEEGAKAVIELVIGMTVGPRSPQALEEAAESAENPTPPVPLSSGADT